MTCESELFPLTAGTWLYDKLSAGGTDGRQEAVEHVMRLYLTPLSVYIKGSSFRRLGDAEDLVSGFFADRLSRETFLEDWCATKRPLRAWLIVALRYYLLEELRRQKRASSAIEYQEALGGPDDDRSAISAFDRSLAVGLVREALSRARLLCIESGLGRHWEVFEYRYEHHLPFEECGSRLGVPAARAAVMARTAQRKLIGVVRELIAWPGASEAEIDAEIGVLMEVVG